MAAWEAGIEACDVVAAGGRRRAPAIRVDHRRSVPVASWSVPPALSAAAGSMLALALTVSAGNYGRRSLALTTAAAIVALGSAVVARRGHGRPFRSGRPPAPVLADFILGATVGMSLVAHMVGSPGPEHIPPRPLSFVVLAAIAFAVLATYGWPLDRVAKRWGIALDALRVPIWLACAAGMGVAVFRSVPAPFIDVWTFQQEAAATLLAGHDPYTHAFTNVFGNLAFFSPAIADNHLVHAFPYPPLTILLGIPAYVLAGDTRYLMLVSLLIGAWGIARVAPGRTGALAAAAVLFHPRTFHVLDRAWTEPTVLAATALALLALGYASRHRRGGWIAVGVAGALLLASKQYALLFVVPMLPFVPRIARWRAGVLASALLAIVFVPFVVWSFPAFWRGVVAMQALQPFRDDSLSWPAALVQAFGLAPLPAWLGFAAAAGAMVVAWPRRGALAGALLCGTVSFLFFLLLGKQAFLNYYWLANALLFAVCALQGREPGGVTAGVAA